MSAEEVPIAEFEVVTPGMLEVLSVGKGDIKISLDPNNPDDVENARRLVEEMIAKGYGIFVETDKGLTRVKKFNAKRMTYVIREWVDEEATPSRPRRSRDVEVPVAGSRAKAIGRTAGG